MIDLDTGKPSSGFLVTALIIVDMLVDFVDGALANPRAQAIVQPIRRLLAHARSEDRVEPGPRHSRG